MHIIVQQLCQLVARGYLKETCHGALFKNIALDNSGLQLSLLLDVSLGERREVYKLEEKKCHFQKKMYPLRMFAEKVQYLMWKI